MANPAKTFPEPAISAQAQQMILDLIGTVIEECQATWNELTDDEKKTFTEYVGSIGAEIAMRYGTGLAFGTLKMDDVIRRLEERARGNQFIDSIIDTVKRCFTSDDGKAWMPE